jgi:hypothetical protein
MSMVSRYWSREGREADKKQTKGMYRSRPGMNRMLLARQIDR